MGVGLKEEPFNSQSLMSKKILIVDDQLTNVQLAEYILKDSGYKTITADNGLDALLMVKNERPDLIVLDVMMPEINGYDVCHQLRFNEEFDKIPILLYTARDKELNDEIAQMARIDYIQKPIDRYLFLQKVEGLLFGDHS